MRYLFEDYTLDTARCELRHEADVVSIAPQVFDLLAHLMRNRDRVVSKDELIAVIWDGRIVSDSALTTRLNLVRNAIGDSGQEQRLLKTLPRKGFRFVGAVREEREHPGAPARVISHEAPPSAGHLFGRPSVVVLPFTNLSGDPNLDILGSRARSDCEWAPAYHQKHNSRCAGDRPRAWCALCAGGQRASRAISHARHGTAD